MGTNKGVFSNESAHHFYMIKGTILVWYARLGSHPEISPVSFRRWGALKSILMECSMFSGVNPPRARWTSFSHGVAPTGVLNSEFSLGGSRSLLCESAVRWKVSVLAQGRSPLAVVTPVWLITWWTPGTCSKHDDESNRDCKHSSHQSRVWLSYNILESVVTVFLMLWKFTLLSNL